MDSHEPDYVVVGEKVALGPLRRDLAASYARWMNQLEVRRGLDQMSIATPQSQEKWVEENIEKGARREPPAVEYASDGGMTIGFEKLRVRRQMPERIVLADRVARHHRDEHITTVRTAAAEEIAGGRAPAKLPDDVVPIVQQAQVEWPLGGFARRRLFGICYELAAHDRNASARSVPQAPAFSLVSAQRADPLARRVSPGNSWRARQRSRERTIQR